MVRLEDIVEVIRGVKGRTTDIVYDLFFSEKRVVAAVVLHFSDLTDIYRKPSLMTMLIGNLPEHREVKMRSLKLMDERRLVFKDKTLDEILASHRANLEVDYENVASVTVKKGLLETSLEFTMRGEPGRKIDFWLDRTQVAEVEGVIRRLLPDKAK